MNTFGIATGFQNSIGEIYQKDGASQVALVVKNLPTNAEDARDSGSIPGWEDDSCRKWHPTPVFLPGKFHWQRNLADYSPWGRKELDMTEQLSIAHTAQLTRK